MSETDNNSGIAESNTPDPDGEYPEQGAGDDDSSLIHYIKRHWRGEMSLAQSLWTNGFLIPLYLILPLIVIPAVAFEVGYNTFGVAGILLCLSLCVVVVWQIAGIWRSASRYNAEHGLLSLGLMAKALALFYVPVSLICVAYYLMWVLSVWDTQSLLPPTAL